MKTNLATYNNPIISILILIMSILVSGFWWLGQVINVYRFDLVGAIYEILWLPVLAMLFILPIISLILWVKGKFNLGSLYLYSILIVVATILFMIFNK